MIWKIWKKSKLKSEKIRKIWKKNKLKSEKIWEIQKKGKQNSEKIWKIWRKGKLNSEKIWKIWKKSKLNSEMIQKICHNYTQRDLSLLPPLHPALPLLLLLPPPSMHIYIHCFSELRRIILEQFFVRDYASRD